MGLRSSGSELPNSDNGGLHFRDKVTSTFLSDARGAASLEEKPSLQGTLRADDGIRTRDPHLGKVMRFVQ
jgi:hypothetical protein